MCKNVIKSVMVSSQKVFISSKLIYFSKKIGLDTAFSYILIQLNALVQNRSDLSDYEVYDQISLAIELIDQKIYEFNSAITNYLIDSLIQKNKISLSVLMVFGIVLNAILLICYIISFEIMIKPWLIKSRAMLKLISVNFLSKSPKIIKYLAITSQLVSKKN